MRTFAGKMTNIWQIPNKIAHLSTAKNHRFSLSLHFCSTKGTRSNISVSALEINRITLC